MTNRQWQICEKCGKQYIDEESDICPQCQDELYCELCNLEEWQNVDIGDTSLIDERI